MKSEKTLKPVYFRNSNFLGGFWSGRNRQPGSFKIEAFLGAAEFSMLKVT